MRVLFWAEAYPPQIGGLEVFTSRLAVALRARGHEVAVVTSHLTRGLPDNELVEGVPVYRFPFRQVLQDNNLAQIVALRQRVLCLKQEFRPELVHLHVAGPTDFFHLRTITPGVPNLVTIHAPLRGKIEAGGLLDRILATAQWITAVSASLLDDIHTFSPRSIPRSSVILNGLPMPGLAPSALAIDPPRLATLGRMAAEKGFDVALDALALVRHHYPTATLVVAGNGDELPLLKSQAARLGLANAVSFPGWVHPDDVPALIDSASLVVMPSRWREPFGLVALQAAQMARPIVATRVGGIPEVVIDGETGWLVEKDDPAALAAAILRLLDNPDQAAQMGAVARQRAQDAFDFYRCVDDYVALYRQLV